MDVAKTADFLKLSAAGLCKLAIAIGEYKKVRWMGVRWVDGLWVYW